MCGGRAAAISPNPTSPLFFARSHRRVLFTHAHKHMRLVLLSARGIYDQKHGAFLATAAARHYVSSLCKSLSFLAPACSLVRSARIRRLTQWGTVRCQVCHIYHKITLLASTDFTTHIHSQPQLCPPETLSPLPSQPWKPSSRLDNPFKPSRRPNALALCR